MRDGPLQELWSARQLRSRQGDDAPVLAEQPYGRPSGMSDETEQLIRAAQNGDARAVQRAVASAAYSLQQQRFKPSTCRDLAARGARSMLGLLLLRRTAGQRGHTQGPAPPPCIAAAMQLGAALSLHA